MSNRSKSGWKRSRHQAAQRWKRRTKRKRAALIAAGHLQKGKAPVATASAETN